MKSKLSQVSRDRAEQICLGSSGLSTQDRRKETKNLALFFLIKTSITWLERTTVLKSFYCSKSQCISPCSKILEICLLRILNEETHSRAEECALVSDLLWTELVLVSQVEENVLLSSSQTWQHIFWCCEWTKVSKSLYNPWSWFKFLGFPHQVKGSSHGAGKGTPAQKCLHKN